MSRKKRGTQNALIHKKIRETKDTVTLRLKQPKPMHWKPGQFIMVEADINGERVKRAYSVSSSPTIEDYLAITIRQTEDPTMSKYLNDIEEGMRLNIRGSYGRFIWTGKESEKAIFLAAGSGITPFRAFLQYMIDKNIDNEIQLLYSCGHGDNVIFKDQIEEFANKVENGYYELSLTREPDDKYPDTRKGRINKEYLKERMKGFEDAKYYMCGSPGFVSAMMETLSDLGIERDQMKREQWE